MTTEQRSPVQFNRQEPLHCRKFSSMDSTNSASPGISQASSPTTTVLSAPANKSDSPTIQEVSTAAILALPNDVARFLSLGQVSSTHSTHSTKSAETSPISTPSRGTSVSLKDPPPTLFALLSPPSSTASKTEKKKKKPRNSYMLYRRDMALRYRAQFKARRFSSSRISEEVGRLWRLEPESVKRQYEAQADHEKFLYDQEDALPKYSYEPVGMLSVFLSNSPRSASAKSPSSSPTPRAQSSFSELAPASSQSSAASQTASVGKAKYTTAPQFIIPPLTSSSLPPKPPMAMTGMFSTWSQPSPLESSAFSSSSSVSLASRTSVTGLSLLYEKIELGPSGGGVSKSRADGLGRKNIRSKKPSGGGSKTGQQSPPLAQQSQFQVGAKKEEQRGEHEAK